MQDWENGTQYATVTKAAGEIGNLAAEHPAFSGTVTYEFTVESEEMVSYIDLGTVGEVAEVTVNGISCGKLVSTPFRFRVKEAWQKGENKVQILVATNCGYVKKNFCSKSITLPPMGLVGPVKLA